jgi:SAM-dependent methyltransferase
MFTPSPNGIQPSDKLERGPHVGTPWRQANWRFLDKQISLLSREDLILDVGAGRGDFVDLFQDRKYLALDVYPYPEVDIVCDLTLTNPFRDASFDAIVLMNVLEHVYDTHALLFTLAKMLKAQGTLILAIPFMVKMHQVPLDFTRYTHFALERLGKDHGLEIEILEGFYDPVFFLGEGIGNLKWSVLPAIRGARHYVGRAMLGSIQILANALRMVTGPGQAQPPNQIRSLAPTGYQIVYRKS